MAVRTNGLFRKILVGIALAGMILFAGFGKAGSTSAQARQSGASPSHAYLPLILRRYPPSSDQTLTVKKSGSGSGRITSDPAGIDCGATCSAIYGFNASVSLTAIAGANSTFDGWSGSGCSGTGTCTVTMNTARMVTASFSSNTGTYLLRVGTTGTGSGTITSNPTGIDCPSDCFYDFAYGTQVTLTATPDSPSTFGGWNGDVCSGTDPCVITMDTDKQVSATFLLPCSGITNCDFESISNVGWVQFSSSDYPIIYNCTPPDYADCNYITPHSGVHLAWLGGVIPEPPNTKDISSIQQEISITSGAPYLVYWRWIESEDPCTSGCDYAQVLIDGVEVDKYNLTVAANTTEWVPHYIDLAAYANKSVKLEIKVTVDDSNMSNLYLDDVSLQASP